MRRDINYRTSRVGKEQQPEMKRREMFRRPSYNVSVSVSVKRALLMLLICIVCLICTKMMMGL